MLDLVRAAIDLQSSLDELRLPNCVIGGLALQAWGELRVTRDADFTLLTQFVDEEKKAQAILGLMEPRFAGALEFAMQNRVLLGTYKGVSVDIGLGGFDFEQRLVERSVMFDFGDGLSLRVCSAEDLILTKTFAGREQDWIDIAGILTRQGSAVDWNLVRSELPPLLEAAEATERLARLLSMRDGT